MGYICMRSVGQWIRGSATILGPIILRPPFNALPEASLPTAQKRYNLFFGRLPVVSTTDYMVVPEETSSVQASPPEPRTAPATIPCRCSFSSRTSAHPRLQGIMNRAPTSPRRGIPTLDYASHFFTLGGQSSHWSQGSKTKITAHASCRAN